MEQDAKKGLEQSSLENESEVTPPTEPPEDGSVQADAAESLERVVLSVPIDRLQPSPYQARIRFEDKDTQELSQSMKAHGLLVPIIIRERGKYYQAIAGERRIRAAKLAGWTSIDAMVIKATDPQVAALGMVENLQRVNLDPIELALALKRLTDEPLKMSLEEIARMVGWDKSVISRTVSFLDEPAAVKLHLSTGQLTGRHVRALKPITDTARKSELANQAAEHGWSSRELKKRVSESLAGPPQPASAQNAAKPLPAPARPAPPLRAVILILVGSLATWAADYVPGELVGGCLRWLGRLGFAFGVLSVLRYLYALHEQLLSALEGNTLAKLTGNVRKLIHRAPRLSPNNHREPTRPPRPKRKTKRQPRTQPVKG